MSDTPKVRRIPTYRKDPHLIKAGIYVYVALTGDQCAITNIRLSRGE